MKDLPVLLLALLAGGVLQCIHGNLQLLGVVKSNHGLFNLTGSYFNPGPFAGVLVSIWVVALWTFLFKDELFFIGAGTWSARIMRYLPAIAVFFIIIILPATRSRAAWLSGIISSAVFFGFLHSRSLISLYRKLTPLYRSLLAISAVALVLIVSVTLYNYKRGSSDGRWLVWRVTSSMIAEHPAYGVGFDQFKAHYMNYQRIYFEANSDDGAASLADNTYYAFNELLQFVAENGFAGLAIVAALGVVLLADFRAEKLYILGFAGVLGMVAFSLFSYPMQILPIKVCLVLFLSVCSAASVRTWRFAPGKTFLRIAVVTSGLVIVVTIFHVTASLVSGYRNWRLASLLYRSEQYEESIPYYEKAYPALANDGEFLTHYGKALVMTGKYVPAAKVLQSAAVSSNNTIVQMSLGDCYMAMSVFDAAEKSYQSAVAMVPGRFYPKYLLARLYDRQGRRDEVIAITTELLTQKIKIESQAISEIMEEMKALHTKYTQKP